MTIQHSAIPDAQLHQPKGASTAVVNETIHSDGAGGTTWEKVAPVHMQGITGNGVKGARLTSDGVGGWILSDKSHGSTSFVNIATPYVLAATTSFTKAAPTTTPSAAGVEFTESTNGRLTYTGAATEHFDVVCGLSLDHAAGVNRDVSIAIAKNGTVIALSEQINTCATGNKVALGVHADTHLATNDYVEVFVKISAAGNVNIYCFSLQAIEIGVLA